MASFFTGQFTGGMNEVLAPSLLDEKTASLLVNADISSGKIVSIRNPKEIPASSPEELHHYGKSNRSTVKFYERTYWSINDTLSPPYYGGDVENYLGIPYPDYNHNVVFTPQEGGGLTGNFKYCVTFVNENGWEGAPGSILDYERSLSLENNSVEIKVDWSDSRIYYAKIYRTSKEGAEFFCVGTVATPGESFVDETDDYTLAGLEPLATTDNYPPPEKGKYLCESGGVFFLAVGGTLYFSALGNPHAWPPLNFVGINDTITGIVPEFEGVLVFTSNNTYRITGAGDIETLSKVLLPGNQGCVNYRSVSQISNAPIWLSNDGICLWNGQSINIISHRIIKTSYLQVVKGVCANDCYYLFLNKGAIVFDNRNGGVFYRLDVSCDYAWYDADTDILYLQNGNGIYQHNAGEDSSYRYVSPLIGMPESTHSFYKELLLCIDGRATVSITVDEHLVFSVTLHGSKQYRLKLPYNSIGRFAQVSVTGIGALRELGVTYA